MDVTPTVLGLAGLPPLGGVAGRSLLPLVAAPQDPGRPVEARDQVGPIEFFAIRTSETKFVVRRDGVSKTWVEETYDLRSDPREEHPLPDERRPAFGPELQGAVDALRTRLRGARRLAEDVENKGYPSRGLSGC